MIRINCTNCKAQLSIDEAFAGGVCRCQYCGTIQTVPKHLRTGAGAPGTVKAGNGDSKALYKRKARTDRGEVGLSSGLDAIADAVASSGLSGSGLANYGGGRPKAAGAAAPPQAKNRMVPLLVGAAILIVLLSGVVIGLLMKGGTPAAPGNTNAGDAGSSDASISSGNSNSAAGTSTPSGSATPSTPSTVAPVSPAPSLLGVRLNEPTIIFVLDHGDATRATFDYLRMAVLNTADSLRPEQKFQVIFWKLSGDKEPAVGSKSLIAAGNKDEVRKNAAVMDDVVSHGQSDPKAALEKAFAAKPAAVVLATGKAMDDSLVKIVMDARKGNPTKVYCLSLGEPANAKVMRDVASRTGGSFRLVPLEELRSVTR